MSLETPRWPGGPPICEAVNLPAFKTRKEMKAFQESLMSNAIHEWECDSCGCFHYEAKVRAPAGGSSGTERDRWCTLGKYNRK